MVDPAVQRRRWYAYTSSLNEYVICNNCDKQFSNKYSLTKHFRVCGYQSELVCEWCNISFKNRGNLVTHSLMIHSNAKVTEEKVLKIVPKNSKYKCDVCDASYEDRWKLKYHIRREHYNLTAKMPSYELKQVNQTWFENVLNTNIVMEIKKTNPNVLVMRKLGPSTDIKTYNESDEKIIDLTHLYPTTSAKRMKEKCVFCNKIYSARCLQKHIDEKHNKIAKHHCNNCLRSFKRHYIFVRHVCHKGPRTRRKRTNSGNLEIRPAESKPPKKTDLRTRLLHNNLPFKSKR